MQPDQGAAPAMQREFPNSERDRVALPSPCRVCVISAYSCNAHLLVFFFAFQSRKRCTSSVCSRHVLGCKRMRHVKTINCKARRHGVCRLFCGGFRRAFLSQAWFEPGLRAGGTSETHGAPEAGCTGVIHSAGSAGRPLGRSKASRMAETPRGLGRHVAHVYTHIPLCFPAWRPTSGTAAVCSRWAKAGIPTSTSLQASATSAFVFLHRAGRFADPCRGAQSWMPFGGFGKKTGVTS